MPPADDDFDIYGEDDGYGTVKVDEVSRSLGGIHGAGV